MIYVIYPNDPSTYFMIEVVTNLKETVGEENLEVIDCLASDSGYTTSFENLKAIPDGAKVVFIGHSTPLQLYGGMSSSYERKELVRLNDMAIFKKKKLFLVSCFSNKIITSSRGYRECSNCIGFGLLPSELSEVRAHSKLNKLNLTQEDIDGFKKILADIVYETIYMMATTDVSFQRVFNYIVILINKKISQMILHDENLKVAEILYYVVNEALID